MLYAGSKFLDSVKAVSVEFHHTLLVADMDKKKIRNVVRMIHIESRKMRLLKDEKIRKRF